MNIITNRKTFISMVFIGLTMLGLVSYDNLPVELFPSAELPMLIVSISSQKEVDPSYMEGKGVIPAEGIIGTLEGIEKIESRATNINGTIRISYEQDINIKYAYLKLEEKVTAIEAALPEEFVVRVDKVDLTSLSNQLMSLQVLGSGGVERVRTMTEREIVPDLENIDGIASANVFGGRTSSVQILLNEDALDSYGLTTFEVRNVISSNNKNRDFVGRVGDGNKYYFVNVTAEYTSLTQIENLVVSSNGPILLKDVAQITFGPKEEKSFSRVNGKESVTLMLINDSQANIIDLSDKVIEVIDKLNKELKPHDLEVTVQVNLAETMEENIDQIIDLAMIGGLLAVFILWIFLRNVRFALGIAFAIPISVYTAFNFFYAYGISLNSLTFVGMALAIGMLLDNSVVVLENIFRLSGQKMHPDKAVVQGVKEVSRSIFAATLTTITVFLPFIFAGNFLVKIIGNNVGVSIISTLLVSLVVALFLIPMLAHVVLKTGRKASSVAAFERIAAHNRINQVYQLCLKACMRNPALTIISAIVLFFATLGGSLLISTNTLQEVELDEFKLYVVMPGGATLETTDQVVAEVENRLENLNEKKQLISSIEEGEAVLTIILKDEFKKIEDRTLADIKADIEERTKSITNAEISFDPPQSSERFRENTGGGGRGGLEGLLGMGSQTESVIIKGQDFGQMRKVADDIQYYLEQLESMSRVSLNIASNRPEVHMNFDAQYMSQYGITMDNVASELNSFQNEFGIGVKFKQGTQEYDIILKTETKEEEDGSKARTMDELKELPVKDQKNISRELQQFTDLVYSSGLSNINRVNQEKQIELTYQFFSEVNSSSTLLDAARAQVDQIIEGLPLPAGIAVEVNREQQELQEYYFLIGAAFILVYMILASVFESLVTPFVLMFSIPLAAIGSLLALLITGQSLLNANTLTGFLILLGVVVNNGIILIDYSRILQKRGYSLSRALMTAGVSRVRPILITAITTIVALIPLAMGDASYVSNIGAPFAITVIGGLTFSTVFTLIFIPTFYSGLTGVIKWLGNLKWYIQAVMLLSFTWICYYVYFNISSILWQAFDIVGALILIPAITYFVLSSLRKANKEIISAEEDIVITIQNVVKVYGRDSRFLREWRGGQRIRKYFGIEKQYKSIKDFVIFIWQIPLISYLFYFTYSFLEKGFWVFVFSLIVYGLLLNAWNSISEYWLYKAKSKFFRKLNSVFSFLVIWMAPLVHIAVYKSKWESTGLVITIGVFWYMILIIKNVSEKLQRNKVNINRLKGRFSGLRRTFYSMVLAIPFIGKKKEPFKALKGVSLEIEKGMFGLLGPNGAGKTTLMRIICGIFEQSYGKVWFNGMDAIEKREELQGLIGYLPQYFGTYENMTAWEFLDYQAILKDILDTKVREERVTMVLNQVNMFDRKDEKIGSFSGGMKQRIGIAQILLHLPRILVVDEPTAGLDPRERIRFRNLLVELSRERIVIFSTHIIEDISSSCKKVAVLNRGSLEYLGKPANMTKEAQGHVWEFNLSKEEFEEKQDELMIVHHMHDGDQIKVRCISADKPVEQAEEVKPLLEDAYLWLLQDKSEAQKEKPEMVLE